MTRRPTFAIVTIGSGSYLGSTVHDLTLANALRRRGYEVYVYWMLEETPELVGEGVKQRILCHGTRYQFSRPSDFMDLVIGTIAFSLPRKLRRAVTQSIPGFVETLMRNLVKSLYGYESTDVALAKRLARMIERDGVTHVKMSFGSIAPLAEEAKKHASFDYLATFQGDEEFAAIAARCGIMPAYRRRVDAAVRGGIAPAIVLSKHYALRLVEDIGLDGSYMEVSYCGIEPPGERPPFSVLASSFPDLRPDLPIVAFVGRQESEKGIDLLLYASKLLVNRGVRFQLVICGATAKGLANRLTIKDIICHLGLDLHHAGAVSMQTRDALFGHSRCVVCPSINGEPFGLVVAEAMARGAAVVVPDYGGVAEVVEDGEIAGGLRFATWDSGDLARQIERLLTDDELHSELSGNARRVAARFSTARMTDAFLEHLGLPPGLEQANAGRATAPQFG